MIVPAKMFSAMGVWTSLEPQLTTPQPQPLPTRRSCAPRKAKRLIADIETWLRAQNQSGRGGCAVNQAHEPCNRI
jgi:hypothetical protein